MTSRGKKLVSLVVSNNDFTTENIQSNINARDVEIQETLSIFNNDENIMMSGIELHQTLTDGEQSDDSTEKELESFFGDVSDTDDPTYHPQDYSPHMGHVDSADLVTLDDLLGRRDNETREQFEVEELQNIIEAVQEGEKQNSEATAVVEDFLTDLLKKTWLLLKPTKRWRKSDPSCWARNVAKKRRADGLSYRTKSKVRPAKVPKDIDCCKCQFKCTDIFTAKNREEICRYFWNLDFQGKKKIYFSQYTNTTSKTNPGCPQ
ncbi:unnamed protein product [Diatraea saccharalis]|uniref:Uncharacterized protein n=1 Tax=Diatraea saccharalis TaxID=40085 RepID=A0A9N9WJM7_9NEOP|nr:unnamed protein product [Diatraea saccharalis]